MLEEKEIRERIKKGWLRIWTSFEVIGTAKDIVEKAMKEHLDRFEKDDRVELIRKSISSVETLEMKDGKFYSIVAETEFLTQSFKDLINLVLFYGPSACEILAPERIELSIREAQEIVNTLGGIMHRLSERLGGIVVKRE